MELKVILKYYWGKLIIFYRNIIIDEEKVRYAFGKVTETEMAS